jgi:UrcA family protein
MNIRPLPALFAALGLAAASQAGAQALTAYTPPPPVGGDVVITALLPWGGEARSEPVFFRDLDLRSEAGGRTLLNRIRGAARRTCDPMFTVPGSFDDRADYFYCFKTAVSQAVADLNIPSLKRAFETTGQGDQPRGSPPR